MCDFLTAQKRNNSNIMNEFSCLDCKFYLPVDVFRGICKLTKEKNGPDDQVFRCTMALVAGHWFSSKVVHWNVPGVPILKGYPSFLNHFTGILNVLSTVFALIHVPIKLYPYRKMAKVIN